MQVISFETVTERLSALLSIPIERLAPDAPISELVRDSLELVEMAIDLQEDFDVMFTQNDLKELVTVRDLVTLVLAR